jgi:hypothetical protein
MFFKDSSHLVTFVKEGMSCSKPSGGIVVLVVAVIMPSVVRLVK